MPGYNIVLEKGLKAIQDEAVAELQKERPEEEKIAIESMLIANRAVSKYVMRYANEAKKLIAETDSEDEKEQLKKIAKACERIAYNKPETFFEAVQLLWIVHEVVMTEVPPSSVSFGRMDKYLYPYYERDVANGIITYDEAAEIVDALWIKLSSSEHAYQNVTLGGADEDGNYIANAVTYMCMQASRKFRYDQPLISLRYTPDIPEEFWKEIFDLLMTGTGFPALFNDAACIPAKLKRGLSEKDAKDYCVIGCVEINGSGCEHSNTEGLRVNIPVIIELMLNRGVQRIPQIKYPLKEEKNLDEIKTFDEFYQWFKTEFVFACERALDSVLMIENMWSHYYPEPFLSSIMRDCIQKGKDVTAGGTTYNNSALNGCGFANAVNSLSAIKKVVFEDKLVTLSELADAIDKNFEGYEDLHHVILTQCPKYGNDDDRVDYFMTELVDMMHDITRDRKNSRGGTYQVGLFSVEDHAFMGECTGALPDGRLSGVALSNGFSPVQGTETEGPTAVVNSTLKCNTADAANGVVLDLKFSPSFLAENNHKQAVRSMINTYFKNGGHEVQFNVVSRKTLLAAQKNPQEYRDLVVRVSGFSAYFCNLCEVTQNEIIARTEFDRM